MTILNFGKKIAIATVVAMGAVCSVKASMSALSSNALADFDSRVGGISSSSPLPDFESRLRDSQMSSNAINLKSTLSKGFLLFIK